MSLKRRKKKRKIMKRKKRIKMKVFCSNIIIINSQAVGWDS